MPDRMTRIDRWLTFGVGLLWRAFAALLLLALLGSIVVLGSVLVESFVRRWP